MRRQQFRRAGLLISPRSKRLLNAVHADLAQQTLRLNSMLVSASNQERSVHRVLSQQMMGTVITARRHTTLLPASCNCLLRLQCPDEQGDGGISAEPGGSPSVVRPTEVATESLRNARHWELGFR